MRKPWCSDTSRLFDCVLCCCTSLFRWKDSTSLLSPVDQETTRSRRRWTRLSQCASIWLSQISANEHYQPLFQEVVECGDCMDDLYQINHPTLVFQTQSFAVTTVPRLGKPLREQQFSVVINWLNSCTKQRIRHLFKHYFWKIVDINLHTCLVDRCSAASSCGASFLSQNVQGLHISWVQIFLAYTLFFIVYITHENLRPRWDP